MIKAKLVSLEKRLLPELPGFRVDGRLVFIAPINLLIRGLHFEGSQYNDVSFHVTAFAMPLCVPTNYLYFNFGDRIRQKGGGDRWSLEMPNLVEELGAAIKLRALPFLSRVDSLLEFVEVAKSSPINQRTLEAIGFTLARAGRITQAIEIFDQLLTMVDTNVAWQRDLAEQVGALKSKLINSPSDAQEQLAAWEAETVQKLGLRESWERA